MTRIKYPKPKNKLEAKLQKEIRDKLNKDLREMRKERRRKALEIPRETRQAFIDDVRAGMSIGQAREKNGIEELEIALTIYRMNIVTHKYYTLREKVV